MNLRFAPSALACGLLFLVVMPSGARAQTMLLNGLGGPADYGPGVLDPNDDGSTTEIDVSMAFPNGLNFFGTTYHSLFANNNGNITFGANQFEYTPRPFPAAAHPMIAPWWGDVDTRIQTGGHPPDTDLLFYSVTPGQFVATWHNVGYYNEHDDLLNDFQLILRQAGCGTGDFDVEFRYRQLQWTTGDASQGMGGFGGTPAQAGFDAGDNVNFTSLPGSFTMAVLQLVSTSNVGVPGVWRFSIRGGGVMCPGQCLPCSTGLMGVCGAGITHCMGMSPICVQNVQPSDEVCDGMDQDCDGMTDEDLGSTTCGVGDCMTSVQNCVNAMTQTCVPLPPHDEVCDLHDNDCDGVTDEDQAEVWCGLGICRRSVPGCTMGHVNTCIPGMPMREICNGLDNDCDGVVGNGLDSCVEPDAWMPPDAWVHPDLGMMDGGVRDTGPGGLDACLGRNCDVWRINGRAGPGCTCRVGERSEHGPLAGIGLAAIAILIGCRRAIARKR
jgi:hypothetical protein